MQNVHFTSSQLAKLLEVNVSTIKRWIDRGILAAEVTPGGHRRVYLDQLAEFFRKQPRNKADSYILRRMAGATSATGSGWKQFYSYLFAHQLTAARKFIMQQFLSTMHIAAIIEEIFVPTLHAIGKHWESGEISIYQEHQMTFIVRQLLIEMDAFMPTLSKKDPLAVLACTKEERHEIPLHMASLIAKEHGIQTVTLGASIPYAEIAAASLAHHANYVIMARPYENTADLRGVRKVLAVARNQAMKVLLGGKSWSAKEKSIVESEGGAYIPSLKSLEQYFMAAQ